MCDELGERIREAVKDDLLDLLAARSDLGEFSAEEVLLSVLSPVLALDYSSRRDAFAKKHLTLD